MGSILALLTNLVGPLVKLINSIFGLFKKSTEEKVDEAKTKVNKQRKDLEKNPDKRPPSHPL